MDRKKIIVAIIPARGGSKGLARKNVRLLAGIPLIAYTIRAALKCSMIKERFVSTDDLEVKRISQKFGANVIDRPRKLSRDKTNMHAVVRHALRIISRRGIYADYFVLLQPTSPLRTSGHIKTCLREFLKSKANCVISVTESKHHPYKSLKLQRGLLIPLFNPLFLNKNRQQLPKIYRQNGAIYAMSCKLFLKKRSFFIPPAMPFIMDHKESIDIDNPFDFKIAEYFILNDHPQIRRVKGMHK